MKGFAAKRVAREGFATVRLLGRGVGHRRSMCCRISKHRSFRTELHSYVPGTSFLLLFPPMFNRARNRTLEAVRRHDEFANLVKGFNAKLADSTQMLPVFEVGLM
jgi:hypothetical protein